MLNRKTSWIPVCALLMFGAAAQAQVAELGAYGGIHRISGKDLGSGYSLDDGWLFGFRLALNSYRFFGHEFGYGYNRTTWNAPEGEAGSAIHRGFYNFLVYGLPEGTVVRPYGTGGVHFNNYVFPGYSVTQGGGSTKFGVNYGGGIKVRVAPMWGIRFDVRNYWNGKPFGNFLGGSGKTNLLEMSAGFSFLL
ncbi:MAG: outer membrane beta-barrel protein [Bryobacteraceae bacterium]|nr:outer membrane beta-barrel protein [Bryobacteraceae bacterium]